jgi:hypothetical protein
LQLRASSSNGGFHPFETRDQNLFNLIHGQALPTDARLLSKDQNLWSSSLIVTNTLNSDTSSEEEIYLDYEAYRFNLSYQYGFDEGWNFKIDVPVMHQSAGFLDSAIDNWHTFFGLPRGNRPLVADDQYDIHYTYQGQNLIELDEASTTLGDIQLAVAHSLIEQDSTQFSIWAGLKLPTGDSDKLSGSGATDLSAWLALNQQLAKSWRLNLNAGAVIPGQSNFHNIPLSDYTLYGHLMLGWLATDIINLKVQLQGHTSFYDQSQLKILDNTYFATFGGSLKINSCQWLDFAVNEDIKVDSSPDASFLFSWRGYSDC